MLNPSALIALTAVFLLLPVVFLLWATESPQQSARRMRRYGHTFKTISARLGVSPSTARRYCLA